MASVQQTGRQVIGFDVAGRCEGWVSVTEKRFAGGADPTGVADATAAIAAAIAAARAGDTVLFPPGTYLKSNSTSANVIGKTGITFSGYGATIRAPTPNPNQYFSFWVQDSTGIRFEGLTFDRRNSYESGRREDGIFFERSPDCVIEDCDFSECYIGVYVTDSPRVIVKHNRMVGRLAYNATDDTNLLLPAQLCNVLDSTVHASRDGQFVGNYTENVSNAIYNEDGDNWTISGNISRTGHDSQIYTKAEGCTVVGNVIEDAGKDGIKILSNTGGKKSVVTGNVILRPGQTKSDGGVAITVSGTDHVVSANRIELDALANLAATSTHGIVTEGHGIVVTGNAILGTGANENQYGIRNIHNAAIYAGDQYDVLISGNVVRGVKYGIRVDGHATYVTRDFDVSGNHVSGGYFPIFVSGISGALGQTYNINVYGNTLHGWAFVGVDAYYSGGGAAKNNDFTGPGGGTAIRFTACDKWEAHHNTIKAVSTGILTDAGTTALGTLRNIFTSGVTTPYNIGTASARTERANDLVSADRGDASQTITVGTSEPVQRWATTLTANRTVTLSTTGATKGDRFRVVRTGLGAFTLDVGGLKTIPSATAAFVDVAYDGSAWVLTGYGTL